MGKLNLKPLLVIVSVLVATLGIAAGFFDKPHAVYVTVFLTPLFLFFAFLEHISEFKAGKGGFEAKTRTIISNAETAVDGMHAQVLFSAKIMLALVSNKMGWAEHYSPSEVEVFKEQNVKILSEMGISIEVIKKEALSEWHKNVLSFYKGHLMSYWVAARPIVQSEFKKLKDIDNSKLPNALRACYATIGVTDREELIKDFEFIIKNREHRRPDQWLDILGLPCLK